MWVYTKHLWCIVKYEVMYEGTAFVGFTWAANKLDTYMEHHFYLTERHQTMGFQTWEFDRYFLKKQSK